MLSLLRGCGVPEDEDDDEELLEDPEEEDPEEDEDEDELDDDELEELEDRRSRLRSSSFFVGRALFKFNEKKLNKIIGYLINYYIFQN